MGEFFYWWVGDTLLTLAFIYFVVVFRKEDGE
jgi:hypothetical protein